MSAAVIWRELRPLTDDLFRCDAPGCGDQADTIHLVPWCDHACEQVLFACGGHDPGGYWFAVSDLLEERDRWLRHLADKVDPRETSAARPGGIGLLLDRLDRLARPIILAEGSP